MYIIDQGDRLKLEDVEILISKEAIAPTPEPKPKEEKKEEITELTVPKITEEKPEPQIPIEPAEETKPHHYAKKGHHGIDQLKSLVGHTLEGPKPGILVRLLCWLADMSLVYLLIYTLIPLADMKKKWMESLDVIKTTIDPLLALLPESGTQLLNSLPASIYHFMVGWILIELLGNIIFATPFTYAILGMKSSGRRISKRIKAIIRSLLVLTDLFAFVNIQTVFKKKTFKEYITFSEIYYSNKILSKIGIFIFIPILIIASLLSPFAIKPSALETLDKEITITPYKKINSIKPDPSATNLDSPYFTISAQQVIPSGTKIVPVIGSMSFWMIDPDSKREVNFSTTGPLIMFKKIISTAAASNPLFHFNYPDLATNGQWNANKQDQLNRFTRGLLELNLNNLPQYILKHGPFIISHFIAKELLLNSLPKSTSWEIHPNAEALQTLSNKNGELRKSFFVIRYPFGQFYLTSGHLKAKKFLKQFSTVLFQNGKWKKPTAPKEIDSISFLDLISKFKKGPTTELANQIKQFYQALLHDALRDKNPVYQAIVLLSITDIINYLKNNTPSFSALIQQLQALESEYENGINLAKTAKLIKKDLRK